MQRGRHSLQKELTWETYGVNRAFIIINSIFSYRTRKNARQKYCKIDIAWYLHVHEAVDHIFIHTQTLHVYFGLCQSTHMVSEKFKQFVIYLRQKCITDKYDAVNILRKIYDTESNIECELIAYALNNIVHDAFHEK